MNFSKVTSVSMKMKLSGFTRPHASRNNFKSDALGVDRTCMNPMKLARSIKCLVFVILACGLSFGCCNHQKPRPDEIVIIINVTHSTIWKCPNCAFGQGLNVQCGSSIDYSVHIHCVECVESLNYSDSHGYAQCKTCRKCADHEKTSGKCLKEEDTTKCLGRCHEGYYWEKLTASCQQCGECCGERFQHEKQCEGLPITHQCRQTAIKCQHPTTAMHDKKQEPNRRNTQGKNLTTPEVVAIVVSTMLFIIVVIIVVIVRLYGWQKTKNFLRKCFCFCCHTVNSSNGVTCHFSDEGYDERDLESTSWKGSNQFYLEEVTDEMGPLLSVPPVVQVKRPGFQRLSSVPVGTCSKVKSVIPRSRSHPGCLGKLGMKEQLSENKTADRQNGGIKEKIRKMKLKMGGYAAVSTEPDPAVIAVSGQACLQGQREDRPKNESPPDQNHKSTSTTGLHNQPSIPSMPEDFQNSLLSRKMAKIPITFYRRICVKLDKLRDCFWDDYRMVGEAIGLEKDEVALLGQIGNATDKMMQKFDSQGGSSIGKFRNIVKGIGRDDVVSIIDEWIVYEWNMGSFMSRAKLIVPQCL